MSLLDTFKTDAASAVAAVEKLGQGWFIPFRNALVADAHALLTSVITAESPSVQVALATAGTSALIAGEQTTGDVSAKLAAAEAAFLASIRVSGVTIADNTVALAIATIKADLNAAPAPAAS